MTERSKLGTLHATMDHRGELDEIFLDADHVHIERMDNREFWLGVTLKNGETVHVRTGIAQGIWYFNVDHDATDGSFYSVQKPTRYGKKGRVNG